MHCISEVQVHRSRADSVGRRNQRLLTHTTRARARGWLPQNPVRMPKREKNGRRCLAYASLQVACAADVGIGGSK